MIEAAALEHETLALFGLSRDSRVDDVRADRIRSYVAKRIEASQRPQWEPKSMGAVLHMTMSGIAESAESPIEQRMALALCEIEELRGRFEGQLDIGPYRIDLAFPVERLAVECDGRDFHTTPDQIRRDQERDRFLARVGWLVIRFRGAEIHRRPAECAQRVAAVYRRLRGSSA